MNFRKASPVLCLLCLAILLLSNKALSAPSFKPSLNPVGWISAPTLSALPSRSVFDVTSGNEIVFSAHFSQENWSGDIRANPIRADGVVLNDESPAGWVSPAERLNKRASTSRNIVTFHKGEGIPFRANELPRQVLNKLGASTAEATQLVGYVRGDKTNEGRQQFRPRESILGPIIHSNIHYWQHSAAPGKPEMIYAGSNGGMLHAFNARTGEEEFAFIPSILLDNLPRLATGLAKNTAFVDGQISIARVKTGKRERTILVGTLGAGGKGLYAIDISNPKAANEKQAATKVMWEATQSDEFPSMGHIYGPAQIARLKTGQLVVITGNGYSSGGMRRSILYVIDLLTGKKIQQIIVSEKAEDGASGLSTPSLLDSSGNSYPDVVYAGDIDGVLWKFNLADFTAKKLYEIPEGRAITTAPKFIKHPLQGYMVVFGSGRVLTRQDDDRQFQEAIHGVWDGAPADNKEILTQQFLGEDVINKQKYRAISRKQPDWKKHRGWRVSLPQGERVIGESPIVNDSRYYFRSTDPSKSKPSNWMNELEMLSGGSTRCPIFDIDRDGIFCSKGQDQPDQQDLINGNQTPVSKQLPDGISSQPVIISLKRKGESYNSTIYNLVSAEASGQVEQPPELFVIAEPPTVDTNTPGGVSNGHFDLDIYDSRGKLDHEHEYDDKHNVRGENLLQPKDSSYRVDRFLNGNSPFKILMMNQYLNPAVEFTVGGQPWQSVKFYGGLAGKPGSPEQVNGKAIETSAASVLAAQPVYQLSNVGTLAFRMPTDAFNSSNWWGEGGQISSGLIPTETGCVNKGSGFVGDPGINGERFNGAFAIQIIHANTPASAIEPNHRNGDLRYGWRVKASLVNQYVLGEYSVFWHAKVGCYGDSGWHSTIGPVVNRPAPEQPPVPPEYVNVPGQGLGTIDRGRISESTQVINGAKITTVKYTYLDNSVFTRITEVRPNGAVWVKTIGRDGIEAEPVCTQNCNRSSVVAPPRVPVEQSRNQGPVIRKESWMEIKEWY